MRRLARFFALVGLLVIFAPGNVLPADEDDAVGLLRLQRAVQAAAKNAYPAFSENAAFSAAMKGYLGSIDAYSTYISPEEAENLRTADNRQFAGVGMDIVQDHKGFLYCLPYAGGLAEQAGIAYGDVLRSIDGIQTAALSLRSVESRVRGEEGTTVRLGVVGNEGLRELVLTRKRLTVPAVEMLSDDGIPRLRIMRFDKRTVDELRAFLAVIGDASSLILDLRGNVGGDLQVAADCAGLFLPDDALIVTLRKRNKPPVVLRAKAGTKAAVGSIVLWQDRFTASSAEVFCAALSQNKRGRTLGQRTFGKGVTQLAVPAGDGGLFVITNAELLPPNGQTYDRKGLEPDMLVVQRSASIHQDFLRRSHEAFGLKP